MNVRHLQASALQPVERPQIRHGQSRPAAGTGTHLRKVTDEVILSVRARAALDDMKSRPDTAASIRTSLEGEPLSEARRTEVSTRIAVGYYQQPHVLRQIAYGVADLLA